MMPVVTAKVVWVPASCEGVGRISFGLVQFAHGQTSQTGLFGYDSEQFRVILSRRRVGMDHTHPAILSLNQ